MSERDRLADRIAAVERAVTDGETDLVALEEGAGFVGRMDAMETRVADLEERVVDLEAATQALRGYVGDVRAVNDEVERRADLALGKAEEVERALDSGESRGPPPAAWTRPVVPRVDDGRAPATTDGWRDAGAASSASTDPTDNDGPRATESSNLDDGSDAGDLRAAVRRLREAL